MTAERSSLRCAWCGRFIGTETATRYVDGYASVALMTEPPDPELVHADPKQCGAQGGETP